jgi:hypothetical protein
MEMERTHIPQLGRYYNFREIYLMLSFLHKRHVILIADKLSVVLLVIIIWTPILNCLKCCLPGHNYVHSNYFTGQTTKVPMLNDSTYICMTI